MLAVVAADMAADNKRPEILSSGLSALVGQNELLAQERIAGSS